MKLLTNTQQDTLFAEFVVAGLLRGDFKSRVEGYVMMRQNGIFNSDDIRDLENLNPLPDGQGQKYIIQLNMQDLAKLGEEPPEPIDEPDPDPDEDDDARKIFMPMFLDAATRCVNRELSGCRSSMAKLKADKMDDFRAWMDKFYVRHGELMAKTFMPAVECLLKYRLKNDNVDELPVDGLHKCCDLSVADSIRELSEALDDERPIKCVANVMESDWDGKAERLAESIFNIYCEG